MNKVFWNPVRGCSPTSPGCANCAAADETELLNAGLIHQGHFNGQIRFSQSEVLRLTLLPASDVYVCPHGDLFHPNVKERWLHNILMAMFLNNRHTYHVLTKRPQHMVHAFAQYMVGPVPSNWRLGVSTEDQEHADTRIPTLLRTQAEHLYLCAYPLLGSLHLGSYLSSRRIQLVQAGSEPQRPAKEEWFQHLQRQCIDWGVGYERADLAPIY